jgi:hypothetical protein
MAIKLRRLEIAAPFGRLKDASGPSIWIEVKEDAGSQREEYMSILRVLRIKSADLIGLA